MTDSPTLVQHAADGAAEFGVAWLILSALSALLIAPVIHATLVELYPRLERLQMTATSNAAVLVGLLAWLVAMLDGQAHAEVHGLVALAFGCAAYWLGPLLRGFVKRFVRSKGDD